MPNLPEYLTDIRQLGTLLTGTLTIVAASCALLLMVTRRGSDLPVKLLGSLFVLAICFAAQSGVVYGIGVFVVATLVTELQFLEKIAALVWNRKEYWEYLSKATRGEVEKKIEAEVKEIEAADAQPVSVAPVASEAKGTPEEKRPALSGLHFHRQVLAALREQRPIPFMGIQTDVKVHVQGKQYLLDAILHTNSGVYIIEIKAGYSPQLLRGAIAQVEKYIRAAGHVVLGQRYAAYPLRGVVVVPADTEAPLHEQSVAVLQFDPRAKTFVNGEAVRQYLESSS